MNRKNLLFLSFCGLLYGLTCSTSFASKTSRKLDALVFQTLKENAIEPSTECNDSVFLRRVYLDVIGTLPTAKQARLFIRSTAPNKRAKLINELLERAEYADYWSLKWCDILRVKAEFPSKLWPNAVQSYHRWVRQSLLNNMPYDQFTRELLTSSGSNFRVPPVNFYRALPERSPEVIAQTIALTFMGMRTDNWSEEKLAGMAAFFGRVGYKGTAEWKEEIIFHDFTKRLINPATEREFEFVLPNGVRLELDPHQDPRVAFADWLIKSPEFSTNTVNRIWFWLFGRGMIHEPDDIRPDNLSTNPALLAFLSNELVRSGYDVKHLYRIILNSKVYQLSSSHNDSNRQDRTLFSHYYTRRLDAEVLIDAISQITRTSEAYSSDIPEPFTFIPEEQRSIKLSDGSITSPFLDLYGRPSRDTGFLTERNNTPSAAQKLHLLNSTHIQNKIINNKKLLGMHQKWPKKGASTTKRKPKPITTWEELPKTIDTIYLTILSRFPTPDEKQIVSHYINHSGLKRYDASVDVVWALLNTNEFIFKH